MKTLNLFKSVLIAFVLVISSMTVSINAYANEYYDDKLIPACCDNVNLRFNYITTNYTSKSVDFKCYNHNAYEFCNEIHKINVYYKACSNCGAFWETVTQFGGIDNSNSCHK